MKDVADDVVGGEPRPLVGGGRRRGEGGAEAPLLLLLTPLHQGVLGGRRR